LNVENVDSVKLLNNIRRPAHGRRCLIVIVCNCRQSVHLACIVFQLTTRVCSTKTSRHSIALLCCLATLCCWSKNTPSLVLQTI